MYLRRRLCTLPEADTSTWAGTNSWADDTSSWGNAAGWEIRSGIKCKKKNTTLMAIGGLGFSKDGVSPEEQPGVRLQERELRKEASSWFFKDALTVPGFKCQCLYIHMPYRDFLFGGLPGWGWVGLGGGQAGWLDGDFRVTPGVFEAPSGPKPVFLHR